MSRIGRAPVKLTSGVEVKAENGVITVLLKDGSEINVNKKDASYVKLDDFDINDFNKEI